MSITSVSVSAFAGREAAPDAVSDFPIDFSKFSSPAALLVAFHAALAEHAREIAAIADSGDPPTFQNVVVALERSGRALSRVQGVFSNFRVALVDEQMQRVDAEISPALAKHRDANLFMNAKLWAKIRAVEQQYSSNNSGDKDGDAAAPPPAALDAQDSRLLQRYCTDFRRAGADLTAEQAARLQTLNAELAVLETTFQRDVFAEVAASSVWFEHSAELSGLSRREIEGARKAAVAASIASHTAPGQQASSENQPSRGNYLIKLRNWTQQPVLAQLRSAASRAKIMAASMARGSRGGPYDTRETLVAVARRRAERAKLLGFKTFSNFVLQDEMVGSTDRVLSLLGQLIKPAIANARRELEHMNAFFARESACTSRAAVAAAAESAAHGGAPTSTAVTAAHFDFVKRQMLIAHRKSQRQQREQQQQQQQKHDAAVQERRRQSTGGGSEDSAAATEEDDDVHSESMRAQQQAKEDLAAEILPFFPIESVVRNGVFFAANQLFGFEFADISAAVTRYHDDAWVYRVTRDAALVGFLILDPFDRAGKNDGAQMVAFQFGNELNAQVPVLAVYTNFPRYFPASPVASPNHNGNNNRTGGEESAASPLAVPPTPLLSTPLPTAALLNLTQTNTLFHEIGHAVHALCAVTRYPRLSGTQVPNDFVEFPAKALEHFSVNPAVLRNYARHFETGEPMPSELFARLMLSIHGTSDGDVVVVAATSNANNPAASNDTAPPSAPSSSNVAYETIEFLACVALDQAWHGVEAAASPDGEDALSAFYDNNGAFNIDKFEEAALARVDPALAEIRHLIPPRYRSPYFCHIISWAYPATYHAYLFCEAMEADAVDWFRGQGKGRLWGLNRESGAHFERTILAPGWTVIAARMVPNFFGRDYSLAPYLRRKGLVVQ